MAYHVVFHLTEPAYTKINGVLGNTKHLLHELDAHGVEGWIYVRP